MVFKLDCLCVYLVAQLCPTLCDPMGYRQQAFVPGIFQANTGVGCIPTPGNLIDTTLTNGDFP